MSIFNCPVRGSAVVQRSHDGTPSWLEADPEIHVMDELLQDAEAVAFIEQRYEIDEPCPFEQGVHHARLKETE